MSVSPIGRHTKMAALENSSAPLRPVKRVQFGILSPEEIVSGVRPSSLIPVPLLGATGSMPLPGVKISHLTQLALHLHQICLL